ncbi:hypothetical protein BC831DRAFT_474988, partial [Entophlyctis helioformis]
MQYEAHDAGRVILKEGHFSTGFYFLLSGQVEVFKIRNGIKYRLNVLNAGSAFGERTMYRLKDYRKACVATTVPCEFLRVHKQEFIRIAQIDDQETRKHRQSQLMSVPHFSEGGLDFIDKILPFCEFVTYDSQQSILLQDSHVFQLYTILSGTCRCVKIVPFLRHKGVLSAYNMDTAVRDGDEVVQEMLTLTEIGPGDHFPSVPSPTIVPFMREAYLVQLLAEDPADGKARASVSVIANSTVEIVGITRYQYAQYATNNMIMRLIDESNIFKVPMNELQAAYLERLKWDSFKKKVASEVISRAKTAHH